MRRRKGKRKIRPNRTDDSLEATPGIEPGNQSFADSNSSFKNPHSEAKNQASNFEPSL